VGVVWDKQFWWSPYAWMKRGHPDSSRSDRREPLKRECLVGEQGYPAHVTTGSQKVQKGSKYANLTPVHLFGPVPSRVGTGPGLGVVASTDPVLEPCLWLSGSSDSKVWTGDRRDVITGCVPAVTPSCGTNGSVAELQALLRKQQEQLQQQQEQFRLLSESYRRLLDQERLSRGTIQSQKLLIQSQQQHIASLEKCVKYDSTLPPARCSYIS
jgi:hypothetical protein